MDTPPTPSAVLDEQLGAVAHVERRRLLVALADHSQDAPPLTVTELGDEVNLSPVVLYHRHLPKLDDTGIIRWDRDQHHVTTGPRFEEIRPLLKLLRNQQDDRLTE